MCMCLSFGCIIVSCDINFLKISYHSPMSLQSNFHFLMKIWASDRSPYPLQPTISYESTIPDSKFKSGLFE